MKAMPRVYFAAVLFVLLCAAVRPAHAAGPVLLQRARDCQAAGRYLEAISLYRDCVNNSGADDEKAAACFGLGFLFDSYLGDASRALEYYRCHIELGGAHSDRALHASARILVRRARCNDAAAYYRDLLLRHPAYFFENSVQKEIDEVPALCHAETQGAGPAGLPEMPGMVRVLIEDTGGPVEVQSRAGLSVSDCSGADAWLPHGSTLVFRADNESLYMNDTLCACGAVTVQGVSGDRLRVQGRTYRSRVSVRARQGRVLVVNHVGLEHYLYGVLPREVYVSWPPAALQAQAVAARTYALYHMHMRADDSYDVLSTTASQVYGGLDHEHAATNAAVDATRGIVVLSGSQLALTLYHANSGGVVEAVEDVWGPQLPYLRRVLDSFSLTGRGAEWSCSLGEDEVLERLASFGIMLQTLDSMQVLKRSGSGRVEQIELRGGGGSAMLSGNSLRLVLGPGVLKSTRFIVEHDGNNVAFSGYGFGHGVGMSQWGARHMADLGFGYRDILAHYYPGTHTGQWQKALQK
jgi:SpoIID/LytB domain protein